MKKVALLLAVGIAAHAARAQVYGKTSTVNPADYDLPPAAPTALFRADEAPEPDDYGNFVPLPASDERVDVESSLPEWNERLATLPDPCAAEVGAGRIAQADLAEPVADDTARETAPPSGQFLDAVTSAETAPARLLPDDALADEATGPEQPAPRSLAETLDAEDLTPVGETLELSEEKTDRRDELIWQDYWEHWLLNVRATTPPTLPVEVGPNAATVTQEGTTHQSALGTVELSGTRIEQLGDDQTALLVQEENTSRVSLEQVGAENLALAVQDASDNSVQLQQIGERNGASLDQLSGGNTLLLRQSGKGNVVRIGQDTPPGGEPGRNVLALEQVGVGNYFSAQQEGTANLTAGPDGLPAEQTGYLNLVLLEQQGTGNAMLVKQEGDNQQALVYQNGQKNTARIVQKTTP